MRVYIGPYPKHFSAYKIYDKWLQFRYKKPYWCVRASELSKTDLIIEKICGNIQDGLNSTINKYYGRKNRKIDVHIDDYDIWSMDDTLAHIILPMLKKMKNKKHGAPFVDDEDVPEELRSTSAPELTQEEKDRGHTDANHFKRWDYVLDEMIFAFDSKINNWEDQFHSGEIDLNWKKDGIEYDGEPVYKMEQGPNHTHVIDEEGRDKYQKRISNGFRLFGKYYESLWD